MTTKSGSSPHKWVYLLLSFTAFWLAYVSWFGPRRPPRLGEGGPRGQATYDWSLLDLEGRPASFEQFRGRTVFLNIWATWCPPCVKEMPSIARLAADPSLQGRDLAFVCVSTDDNAQVVKDFLAGKSWPMIFLRAEEIPPVFLTVGIPATFIINTQGKIVASEVGSADWDDPRVVELLRTTAGSARAR